MYSQYNSLNTRERIKWCAIILLVGSAIWLYKPLVIHFSGVPTFVKMLVETTAIYSM